MDWPLYLDVWRLMRPWYLNGYLCEKYSWNVLSFEYAELIAVLRSSRYLR